MSITHLMTKNLVTCDLNTSVTELMNEMTEKKISPDLFLFKTLYFFPVVLEERLEKK